MLELSKIQVIRPYEAVIMMDSDASEQDQKDLFKKNKSIIESFKGEVNHIDTWGKRKLGNPIANKNRAIYFHTTFTASPECIAELERTMKINDKVIRAVHTRLSDKTPLSKHMEKFKEQLAETLRKEKEKEAKIKARKAARKAGM
ncbi:MAG: 30S ribosomal protein S6 [Bdellovibrionales bacterium]|nr:30S ribosomal protein S6 [Bdellovibrionales bacterium]